MSHTVIRSRSDVMRRAWVTRRSMYGTGGRSKPYRGVLKHGMSRTPTYKSWDCAKQRCTNADDAGWHRYGGRGIRMHERWLNSFENFLADMGECPRGLTLDRIDVNGDYEPMNCRWATNEQQSNNRRTCIYIEHLGKKQTYAQWARETGIGKETIRYRVVRGWSIEKALTQPSRRKRTA